VNLILIGPPASGKGTQAKYIVKKYNYFQLSTGDLLRDEIKKQTKLGEEISKKIDKGEFVNDQIVNTLLNNVITDKSKRNKIIFDGYPRNLSQAKNLEVLLKGDKQTVGSIIYLNLSKDEISKRISGRYICEKCNTTLNEFTDNEEFTTHKCDKKYLKKRPDDNKDTILKRYDTYVLQTKPVLDYYSLNPNFNEIDGSLKIDQIMSKIDEIVNV
tara:strand:- start:3269 stop:3910 length:642 start_codon:yes stop_codon:yes gene_type:complete